MAQRSRSISTSAVSETFALGTRGHIHWAMGEYKFAGLDENGKLPEALRTRIFRSFVASFLIAMVAAGVSVKYGTCELGIPTVSYSILAGWLFLLRMYELSIICGGCIAGGCFPMLAVAFAMLKGTFEQADIMSDGQAIAQTIMCDVGGVMSEKIASAWEFVPVGGWLMPFLIR